MGPPAGGTETCPGLRGVCASLLSLGKWEHLPLGWQTQRFLHVTRVEDWHRVMPSTGPAHRPPRGAGRAVPTPSVPSSGRAVVAAHLPGKELNQDPSPALRANEVAKPLGSACWVVTSAGGRSPGAHLQVCPHTHRVDLGTPRPLTPLCLGQPWQSQGSGQWVKLLCFSLCPQKPTDAPGNAPSLSTRVCPWGPAAGGHPHNCRLVSVRRDPPGPGP